MPGQLDGFYNVPDLAFNAITAGTYSEFGRIIPPGGRVFFVRGNGTTVTQYAYDPPGVVERLNPSVQKALLQCVPGRGDVIYVMEGHTENIASASSWTLLAGVKIIGLGRGLSRPTFTHTATASTVTVNVANVTIANCRFLAAGPAGTTALTVTAGFTVTAAGFQFIQNDVECGVDADQLCTNLMTLAAGADDTAIVNNRIHGGALAEITTVVTTAGAVDRLLIAGNYISASVVTAATGVLLDLSNAAIIENDIINNVLMNNTASSKYVIKPHATSTGWVDHNTYATGDGGTAPAVSGWSTYTTTYKFGADNRAVTAVSVSALLSPAVDA